MAALLCQSLCKLLGDCTACVAYPCRACCDCVGKMLCSPFIPYLTVTLVFNVPLVLWGYETFKQNASHCDKIWWIWVNALMGLGHILGSWYIVYRIQRNQLNPYGNNKHYNDEYYDHEFGYTSTKASKITSPLPQNRNKNNEATAIAYAVSDDDDNSRKPLYKKSIIPAVDSDDAMKYQNLDNPEVRAHPVNTATSPKSVHSTTSLTSTFRDLFNNNKSDGGHTSTRHNNNTHVVSGKESSDGKIESVASMIAGLSESPDDGPSNSFHRLGHVLCYDPGAAVYFFIVVLWVIWQSVGVTVAMSLVENYDDACTNIRRWIVLSTMCGFIYMMLVFFAFGCSLLCLR
jgi:hypothetical protein